MPAAQTPRPPSQLMRATSTPTFTRGEAASYLGAHGTPEDDHHRSGSQPLIPYLKFNMQRRGGVGPRTPPRPSSIENINYGTQSHGGLHDHHLSPNLDNQRQSEDENVQNPFEHDLVDYDDTFNDEPVNNRGQTGTLGEDDQQSFDNDHVIPSRHQDVPVDLQPKQFGEEGNDHISHARFTPDSQDKSAGDHDVLHNPEIQGPQSDEEVELEPHESGDDGSDESFGKAEQDRRLKIKRHKAKELERQENQRAYEEQEAQERTSKVKASSVNVEAAPKSRRQAASKPKGTGDVRKDQDVTSGFDLTDPTDCSSDDEPSGKGKRRARGRPSAVALAKCDDLGESTRAQALAIADEHGMQSWLGLASV